MGPLADCTGEAAPEPNYMARLQKCEFLKDKVDYLGFEVSQGGILASPEKVKAMLDWPRPQSVHDIRSFLGLASYYRKFIKGFSQLAKAADRFNHIKDCVALGKCRS